MNAFRILAIGGVVRGWVCSHDDTCADRARTRARRQRRAGMPPGEVIPTIDKRVAVIGADAAETEIIGQVLTELAGLDIDLLDAGPISRARLVSRDYGCIVVSSLPTDPVAYVSDLRRRLEPMARRGVPIVVCHTPGADASGALRTLIARTRTVTRPFDAHELLEAVAAVASDRTGPLAGWRVAPDEVLARGA